MKFKGGVPGADVAEDRGGGEDSELRGLEVLVVAIGVQALQRPDVLLRV